MGILRSIRSWLEARSTVAGSPLPQGSYSLSAYSSLAPVSVSPENATRVAAAKRCVELISSDFASLPVDAGGPGADLFTQAPNRHQSQFEFRRSMMMQALLHGNGCTFIARTYSGEPAELQLLLPGTVSVQETDVEGGYEYRHDDLGSIAPADIIHIRAPTTGAIWAESPIRQARETFNLSATLSRAGNAIFHNAGVPKVAILHPGMLSPGARQTLEDAYVSRHSGAANAGRPIILGENMRVEALKGTIDDDLYLEAQQFTVSEIARIFGVPLSYLAQGEGSGFGSLEALRRMYVDSCLAHWAEQFRSECLAKVLGVAGEFTYDYDSILRPTLPELMAAMRTGVECGIITRNEAREWIGLPAMGSELDEFTLAKNIGTGGGATNIGTDTDLVGIAGGKRL